MCTKSASLSWSLQPLIFKPSSGCVGKAPNLKCQIRLASPLAIISTHSPKHHSHILTEAPPAMPKHSLSFRNSSSHLSSLFAVWIYFQITPCAIIVYSPSKDDDSNSPKDPSKAQNGKANACSYHPLNNAPLATARTSPVIAYRCPLSRIYLAS